MDKIRIIGGQKLNGQMRISGAKNAALPLMAASLLCDEAVTLTNLPYLADITTIARLLGQHGSAITMGESSIEMGRQITLHAKDITSHTAPYEMVRTMRASVLVLGPLLAREGKAKVSLPGGCAIGSRPIDLHLTALQAMGADINVSNGYVEATAPKGGLQGAEITFKIVSVGATENILMAACLAKGETILHNAAREPEIGDLARMLVTMGAKIEGIDTATLRIQGVKKLSGVTYRVIGDRIEAGTFLAATAMVGGKVTLKGMEAEHLEAVITTIRATGADITSKGDAITISAEGRKHIRGGADIKTQPHPGFPTDMQAQIMTLLCMGDAASTITETIFENRYMHVPELQRMGANITLNGRTAVIRGVDALHGAEVMATDLRASSSLVIAALAAEGETLIHRIYHLDRGYEHIEEKLAACGAQIERVF